MRPTGGKVLPLAHDITPLTVLHGMGNPVRSTWFARAIQFMNCCELMTAFRQQRMRSFTRAACGMAWE